MSGTPEHSTDQYLYYYFISWTHSLCLYLNPGSGRNRSTPRQLPVFHEVIQMDNPNILSRVGSHQT